MTHTDYTRNILNIKDPNIIFDENCLEEKTIDKVTYKVFMENLHTHLHYVLIVVVFMRIIQILLLNMVLKRIVRLKWINCLITLLFFF